MIPDTLDTLLRGDLALTGLVSTISLCAVWIPFYRGMRVSLRALRSTRRLSTSELRPSTAASSGSSDEPLALTLIRVLRKSLWESDRESYPTEFVVDASKQYTLNEYETTIARPISMYANLLPPIGFIGTTGGLLILFLSMHSSNESLELGALALALTSSIFALCAFAVLEGMKIRLYTRLLSSLQEALSALRSRPDSPPAAERRGHARGTPRAHAKENR